MTSLYAPIDLIYAVGGFYVVWNLDRLLPTYRKKLKRALIGLFGIDTVYASAFAFLAINHPGAFNPPMDISQGTILKGSLIGFGFALLILWVMLRLIDQASDVPEKKPAVWTTIAGWTIIAALVLGVAYYGLFG